MLFDVELANENFLKLSSTVAQENKALFLRT